ncbi:hypothetical protein E2C06_07885 [Dankookia rubra]|uniref:Uncharacterized protein n=1 Tax=Dankookia rubra TaxID=1442381 RepID=A0A4R5QIQ5_9PROT|nr:hypothetical protein [Dankookia rubra]TDH63280.1 hypothetical protein E2C06_07885 [Dankookia rubra]
MEAERALQAALDLTRLPPMPAPLARLLQRHIEEAVDRRFAAAALTLAEAAEMIAALAHRMPAAALAPARAWAFARLEQHGAVGIPPALPRALLRGLGGEAAGRPGTALARAQARQAFRESAWAAGLARVPLLPLGLHCLPWNLPARWGFRSTPQAMEALNPFALAAHHLPVVLAALEEGWAGYAPPSAIHAVTTPSGRRLLRRQDGGAVWNHHAGPQWEEDGLAPLRLDLEILARRFERACAAPGVPLRVCFLVTEAAPDAALAQRLLAALRRRVRESRLGLFLLHNPIEGVPGATEHLLPEAVALRVPRPHPTYEWHLPGHFDSPAGFAFEHRIATALRDAIADWQA